MPSILFVCTANRFRSALAAEIFVQALVKEEKERKSPWPIGKAVDWEVTSAGIRAARLQLVLPDVFQAGKQLGIDLSGHRSQRVQDLALSDFDLILVMQESQKKLLLNNDPELHEHIYLLSQVIENDSFDFPDTFDSLHGVKGVADVMSDLIQRNMHYICVLAIALHNKRNSPPTVIMDSEIEPEAKPVSF